MFYLLICTSRLSSVAQVVDTSSQVTTARRLMQAPDAIKLEDDENDDHLEPQEDNDVSLDAD